MSFPAETKQATNEFAAVRVGGAIDGHRVTGALAEGGMGAVFKVRTRDGKDQLALKAPLPGGRGGSYYHRMRRFLREARLNARMNHDGVAKVREQGHADGLPYFTLELIDGIPLSERLYNEGVLPIREAVEIVEKTARAAHHIHEHGVVHRDLKPANILMRKDGTPVIIDFGLARDAWGVDPRITESGIWLGTPAYIAPEQASGEASRVDARADVYSLGAILYELLTGMPPYGVGRPRTIFKALRERDPRPVAHLRAEIPADLEQIVMSSLCRQKDGRYANAEVFANVLADWLAALNSETEAALEVEVTEVSVDAATAAYAPEQVAQGWNEPQQPNLPAQPAPKKARSRRIASANRTATTERLSPQAKASARFSSRRLATRRSDSVEAFGRLLAFCGPAAAATVGLLLLL